MKKLFLLITFLTCTFTPGCSCLQSACAAAVPIVTAAQAYAQDAEVVLDQITAQVQASPMPDAIKAQILKAVDDARTALRAGEATLTALNDTLCKTLDLNTIFADFLKAWGVIEPLIMEHGPKMGATPGQLPVRVPLIVKRARGG